MLSKYALQALLASALPPYAMDMHKGERCTLCKGQAIATLDNATRDLWHGLEHEITLVHICGDVWRISKRPNLLQLEVTLL